MNQVPCTVAADTRRYLTRQERRDGFREQAHAVLRAELIDALTGDPSQIVSTPGFNREVMTAADVIRDSFAAEEGAASLIELLTLVGQLAERPGTVVVLHQRAKAWIEARAQEHAGFHASDLAIDMEDAGGSL